MTCAWTEFLALLPPWLRPEVDKSGRETLRELRLRLGEGPELVGGTSRFLKPGSKSGGPDVCSERGQPLFPLGSGIRSRGVSDHPRRPSHGPLRGSGGKGRNRNGFADLHLHVHPGGTGFSRPCPKGGRAGGVYFNFGRSRQRKNHPPAGPYPPAKPKNGRWRGGRAGRTVPGGDVFCRGADGCAVRLPQAPGGWTGSCGPWGQSASPWTKSPAGRIARASFGRVCGVSLLATAHAAGKRDLLTRPVYGPLVETHLFDHILTVLPDQRWIEEDGQ